VIDELIEFKCEAQETIIIRFAHCFRILFQQHHSDPVVLEYAAKGTIRSLCHSTCFLYLWISRALNFWGCCVFGCFLVWFVALGHLARAGGALTVDIVQFQVKEALEWLDQEDGSERRRLAAVLVLKELARNTPTLFNAYVDGFLDNIWTALRDPNEVQSSGLFA
jgi:hypothetical protein